MTVLEVPDSSTRPEAESDPEPAVRPVLQVRSLVKSYGRRVAVDGVTFAVDAGVTALLGPNGAGKTTIMRCVAGLLSADAGTIEIAGVDVVAEPRRARRLVGYLPERVAFPPEMRVRAYLVYAARAKGIERRLVDSAVDEAMARTDLAGVGARLVSNLSKGFRQRVGLAQATLGTPPLLVLDEPLAGVDPLHVWDFRDVLWEYGREHAVVISTHILPEARTLCDRALVITGGRVAFDGGLLEAELSSTVTRRWRVGVAGIPPVEVAAVVVAAGARVIHQSADEAAVDLVVDAPHPDAIDRLVRAVLVAGWKLAHVEPMTDLIEAALLAAQRTAVPADPP